MARGVWPMLLLAGAGCRDELAGTWRGSCAFTDGGGTTAEFAMDDRIDDRVYGAGTLWHDDMELPGDLGAIEVLDRRYDGWVIGYAGGDSNWWLRLAFLAEQDEDRLGGTCTVTSCGGVKCFGDGPYIFGEGAFTALRDPSE